MLSKNEIKYIQSLRQKKSRMQHQQFIAEGAKIINELIAECIHEIGAIYATEKWYNAHYDLIDRFPLLKVADFELEKISQLETPQQVLAIVKMRENEFVPFPADGWSLMLDGIQDPGNMGSILRIADWFGCEHIYCNEHTVDCYNSKVVQAAMGSLWRVQIAYGNCAEWLTNTALPVYGAMLDGDDIIENGRKLQPGIIIIGSEGKGISPELIPYLKKHITIPRIGKAESLNAAVATGIIFSQLLH